MDTDDNVHYYMHSDIIYLLTNAGSALAALIFFCLKPITHV